MRAVIFSAPLVVLASCAAPQPQPVPQPPPPNVAAIPVTVCPPAPSSGEVCAPPIICRDAPEILALDNAWITRVFVTQDQRQGVAMVTLGLEKLFCGGAPTPVGAALRKRL
jgi:hypothetical protein